MNEPPFEYQQLGHRQIRLLYLRPGQVVDELVGELRVHSLDDDLKYDALSYMWGDSTPVGGIMIHSTPDGSISTQSQMLPIGHNLKSALQSLRYPDTDKTLVIWVDAICINQRDLDERAQQVPLMRHLYSRAQTVRSFINVDGSVDTACDAFKALQSFTLCTDPTFFDPVAPIFANPYWSRVWVQQEVLSAREWVIHCGDATLSCANLTAFHEANQVSLILLGTHNPVKAEIWNGHFRKHYGRAQVLFTRKEINNWKEPLHQLLLTNAALQCTNLCDKLYATMHLASDYIEGSIQVDYTKSPFEVLLDAVEYHIKHNKNIEFLLSIYSLHIPRSDNTYQRFFPTWFPYGWLLPERASEPGYANLDTGAKWSNVQPDIKLDKNSRRLGVRGVHIDCVHRCLTSNVDTRNLTANAFWSSDLGKLIDSKISFEFIETLAELFSGHPWVAMFMTPLSMGGIIAIFHYYSDEAPNRPLCQDGAFSPTVIDEINPEYTEAFTMLLRTLEEFEVVELRSGNLGLFKKGTYEIGDDIWIVLGCRHCIALRPQPDGIYWYSCPAVIPHWATFEGFEGFTEISRTGDRIEEWIVEDIELA